MRTVLTALAVAALALPVRADDPTPMPKVGDKAPDIRLQITQVEKLFPGQKHGGTIALSDLRGRKNVVLYFFPRAMTRGCTIEACGFRDTDAEFAKLDTVVIGISTDPLAKQEQFTKKERLTIPLFADPQLMATKAYGVQVPGRPIARRVTFVIDKEGTIRKVFPKVTPKDHPKEVLAFVKDHLAGK